MHLEPAAADVANVGVLAGRAYVAAGFWHGADRGGRGGAPARRGRHRRHAAPLSPSPRRTSLTCARLGTMDLRWTRSFDARSNRCRRVGAFPPSTWIASAASRQRLEAGGGRCDPNMSLPVTRGRCGRSGAAIGTRHGGPEPRCRVGFRAKARSRGAATSRSSQRPRRRGSRRRTGGCLRRGRRGRCSSTPAGAVGRRRSDQGLGAAHQAIHAWARPTGIDSRGPTGRSTGAGSRSGTRNPARIRTDVFYQVARV